MKRLPSFLILGAEKAGTTWLHAQLSRHPSVFLPGTKEIHFFNEKDSRLVERSNFNRLGIEWYSRFFKDSEDFEAVGEITPMYLCDESAPERIKSVLPQCKMIVILRDPVERAYSHYWMAFRKGHVQSSFEQIVYSRDEQIIQRGLYLLQLKRYLNFFEPFQFLFLEYDNFFSDTELGMSKIYNFLNVSDLSRQSSTDMQKAVYKAPNYASPFFYRFQKSLSRNLRELRCTSWIVDSAKRMGLDMLIRKLNERTEEYPKMDIELERNLRNYYSAQIDELQGLTGLDIEKWKVSGDR